MRAKSLISMGKSTYFDYFVTDSGNLNKEISMNRRVGNRFLQSLTIKRLSGPYFEMGCIALDVKRTALMVALSLVAYLGAIGTSVAGDRFSEQGSALTKALIYQLMAQGVCKDIKNCNDALQMYREDGSRIYLNMYAQTDMTLASTVAGFLVARGLKITEGMPITLRVYPGPKTQYLGSMGSMAIIGINLESIKLEINK